MLECSVIPRCLAVLILFAAGCDPVLNIGGTFFPGWMVSILIGSALTVAIRYVFVFTRLEPPRGSAGPDLHEPWAAPECGELAHPVSELTDG